MDIVILFYCRCVPSFTISIGCAPCSMCVFLKLRSFLDNKCIIAFFLQFIFQSYCFIKRIIFPNLNCIIRILINDIPLVSICNRTIQNILCIRKITVSTNLDTIDSLQSFIFISDRFHNSICDRLCDLLKFLIKSFVVLI